MRIGMTGAHGTGKSTVTEYLKTLDRFKHFYCPPSSARVLQAFGINDKADPLGQWLITVDRHNNICSDQDVITDRTPIDSWAYSMYMKESWNVPQAYFDILDEYVGRAMKDIDLLVYFPVYWDLEDDGVRSLDKAYQNNIDDWILTAMDKFCPYHEIVTMEDESPEFRADKIIAAADELDLILN